MKGVQWTLVVVISCFMLGQNTDWHALASIEVDPESAAWRWVTFSLIFFSEGFYGSLGVSLLFVQK